MAVRSRDRTITIRTNEVVIITIDGASDSTVIRAMSWTTRSVRPAPLPRLTFKACASARFGQTTPNTTVSRETTAARRQSSGVRA